MSTTPVVAPPCPRCKATDSIDLSDGTLLCLQCQNEWNPAHEIAEPAEHVIAWPAVSTDPMVDWKAILAGQSVGDVLAVGDDDDDADVIPLRAMADFAEANDWTDKFVRDGAGVTGLVVTDDGGERITIQESTGSRREVDRSSVMYLGDEPLAEGVGATGITDDEPLPQTMLAVAGLAITVALDSLAIGEGHEWTINSPRIGWLPPPCDQIPEVECGIAYAIAALVGVFGLDTEQVQRLAANLIQGAEVGTESETNT